MIGSLSPRVAGLLAIAGAAVVGALASGQPELAVVAVPFVVFVGVGLLLVSPPELIGELHVDRDRLVEGERTQVVITVRNQGTAGFEVDLGIGRSSNLAMRPNGAIAVRLAAGETAELVCEATPLRWGAHAVGPVVARVRDPLGLTVWPRLLGERSMVRVFPCEQRLRALMAPLRTQPFLGAHVARARGDGIEFADIRPFVAGDRVRKVNWRATARHGAVYVTERHPEHSSDVVLLLDTFAEVRDGAGSTLDAAVRAAASLARAHLARRDRVALVDFGGTLHWLQPGFGVSQLYRIVDALLSSEIAFSYAWRAVNSIPRRVLPPGALILAITPLLDDRSIRLVTDLRSRGADVTVIEVSPLSHVAAGKRDTDQVAHRLWRLERAALRARLQSMGIGVAIWEQNNMLGPALEEVTSFRRSARPTSRV